MAPPHAISHQHARSAKTVSRRDPGFAPRGPDKNGTTTVAVLLPVHTLSRKYLSKVLADIEAAAARRPPEQQAAVDQLLAERGIE